MHKIVKITGAQGNAQVRFSNLVIYIDIDDIYFERTKWNNELYNVVNKYTGQIINVIYEEELLKLIIYWKEKDNYEKIY